MNVAPIQAEILRESGAVLDGHFLLTSGRHSLGYVEKFRLLERPELTAPLCAPIADHFRPSGVEVVAAPTTGGIILAYEMARQLGARGIFAERTPTGREFRRGFAVRPGERVLVVDDILTTGSSVSDVLAAVKREGGIVVGVGVLIDRSGGQVGFGVPLFSCFQMEIATFSPEECPACAAGVPITKPGSSGPPPR